MLDLSDLHGREAESVPPALRRLRDALSQTHPYWGRMDAAVLVRELLLSEQTGEAAPNARVPSTSPWPRDYEWRRAGLLTVVDGPEHYIVAPERWAPPWLPCADRSQSGLAAARRLPRRSSPVDPLVADQFFQTNVGHREYSAPSQREAVRAVAHAPDGGTIVVNLPTGTGKSAVAYSIASLAARRGLGTTLVVVPTTALALDQQRAYQEMAARTQTPAPPVLAYHGELPDEAKRDVRRRIRGGDQQIVFASPEALLSGMRGAAFDAATEGLISLFVVDEAHMAVTWGEEFRPDFQFLASFRNALLAATPESRGGFPTLLMSATLTAPILDRLIRDFATDVPVEVISGAALRPEPEYWIADPVDDAQRAERVLDAVAHLPRPAILYVTRPRDAEAWGDRLRSAGFHRFTIVHGDTPDRDRRSAIHGMRGTDSTGAPTPTTFDLVIGTSAYGLGLDQSDIRTIIHACLPESLDRFYQEVGRGGRDGKASVAMLIPAHSDTPVARRLATDTIIGISKATERWREMINTSDPADGDGRRIRISQLPAYLWQENQSNTAWNLRTLLLLQASGRVKIALEPPARRAPHESDETWDARFEAAWEAQRETRIVEVLKPLDGPADWEPVERAREHILSRGQRGLEALREAISQDNDECLGHAFSREYGIAAGEVPSAQNVSVPVARACGGCPGCRREGRPVNPGYFPDPGPPPVYDRVSRAVKGLISDPAGVLIVLVDDPDSRASVRRLRRGLRSLVGRGLGGLVADTDTLAALKDVTTTRPVLTATTWDRLAWPDLTTAIVATATDSGVIADALRAGPFRFLFVDRSAPDPEWTAGPLAGRPNVLALDDLLTTLDRDA